MTKSFATSVDLFSFTNYRAYFRALADLWTEQGRSMQALAELCGFSSPNFVQQIISGKRNLTENAAEKVAASLGLNENAKQFLLLLVRVSRAKSADEIDSLMRGMKRLIGKVKRRSVADSSIFDNWLYGIVFEMFKVARFQRVEDLEVADLRIGVNGQQLRQAFSFLVKREYLVESDGRWVPANVEFQPQNDVRRINGQQNHLKFLALAQHRINDELADREFQGLTFATSESRLAELKDRIREFIRSVNDEFSEDAGADQVVRLQLGLFKILK